MKHPKTNEGLRALEIQRQVLNSLDFDMWNIDAVMKACDIPNYHTYMWGTWSEIDLTISITSIEDITPILREFAKLDYHQKSVMEKVSRKGGGFKWFLHHPRGTCLGQVTIFGKVVEVEEENETDGTTCKIVQTGTETIERPIYEVVCEEVLV